MRIKTRRMVTVNPSNDVRRDRARTERTVTRRKDSDLEKQIEDT